VPCAFTVQEASDAIIRLDRDDEAYVSMLSQPWLPGNKLNSEIHLVHDRTIMDKGSLAFFVLPCVRIGPSGNDAPLAVLCWQPAALRRRAQLTLVGPARGAHVADFRAPVVGVCRRSTESYRGQATVVAGWQQCTICDCIGTPSPGPKAACNDPGFGHTAASAVPTVQWRELKTGLRWTAWGLQIVTFQQGSTANSP
jgi:hypothetical protein